MLPPLTPAVSGQHSCSLFSPIWEIPVAWNPRSKCSQWLTDLSSKVGSRALNMYYMCNICTYCIHDMFYRNVYTHLYIQHIHVFMSYAQEPSLYWNQPYILYLKKMEADKTLTNLFLFKVWKKQKENPFKHLLSCHRRDLGVLKQVDTEGHKGCWEVEISVLFPTSLSKPSHFVFFFLIALL